MSDSRNQSSLVPSEQSEKEPQRPFRETGEIAKIFTLNKNNVVVEIETQDKILDPFSIITLRLIDKSSGVPVVFYEAETILKCDTLSGGCNFCFADYDYKLAKFEMGPKRETFPIQWKNCITWNGAPILKDSFFWTLYLGSNTVTLIGEDKILHKYVTNILIEKRRWQDIFILRVNIYDDKTNEYYYVSKVRFASIPEAWPEIKYEKG